jgi:hypothetical protein
MVPIRDAGLVGRKIDCPKCKYRFLVEEPAAAEVEPEEGEEYEEVPVDKKKAKADKGKTAIKAEKPAPAAKAKTRTRDTEEDEADDETAAEADGEEADEQPKKKKKKGDKEGNQKMLVVGGGAAILALAAIGVGLWAFGVFGGSKDTKKPTTNTTNNTDNKNTNPITDNKNDKKEEKKDPPKNEGPAPSSLGDITNLLPNETQAVVSINFDKLLTSSFKQVLLRTPGGFNPANFKRTFGFDVDDVSRIVMAVNKDWVFTVVRISKPIDAAALQTRLGMVGEKPVNALTYYTIKKDLDPLGNLLLKGNRQHESFGFYPYDSQTLVFADRAPMEKFLEDGTKPKPISAAAPPPPTKQGPPQQQPPNGQNPNGQKPPNGQNPMGPPNGQFPQGPPNGQNPMGPPNGQFPQGPPNGQNPMGPPNGQFPQGPPNGQNPQGPPNGQNPMGPPNGQFPQGPPNGQFPQGPPNGQFPPNMKPPTHTGKDEVPASGSYLTIPAELKNVLDRVEKADQSAMISAVAESKGILNAGLRLMREFAPPEMASSVDKQMGAVDVLFQSFDANVKLLGVGIRAFKEDKVMATVALEARSEAIAAQLDKSYKFMFGLGTLPTGIPQPPNGFPQPPNGFPQPPNGFPQPPNGFPQPPNGFPQPPNGNPMGQFPQPPNGNPMGQFPQPPNGNPMGQFPQPPNGNPMGQFPPNGQPNPNQGGKPGDKPKPKEEPPVKITTQDATVLLDINAQQTENAYQEDLAFMRIIMVYLRGEAEMVNTRTRIHDLAAATQTYLNARGQFPRGTFDHPVAGDQLNTWAPQRRLSWMVELLPYLGDGDYKDLSVDRNKQWTEGSNQIMAHLVVPQFVAPAKSRQPYRINYPGAGPGLAATHFVGIAGVGNDAAYYSDKDASVANKLGVFGYERVTRKEDLKDVADKTILLIQAPLTHKAPWVSGGGATIRGVSEDIDSFKPFIVAEYNGKKGAFAIMCDGKVRFIQETITPEQFRALCVIKGDKKDIKIDQIAPVVAPEPEEPQLRTNPEVGEAPKAGQGDPKLPEAPKNPDLKPVPLPAKDPKAEQPVKPGPQPVVEPKSPVDAKPPLAPPVPGAKK